jgi:hypothetical protein
MYYLNLVKSSYGGYPVRRALAAADLSFKDEQGR